MGPGWEKPEEHPSRSPLHVGALTEESLPSSASPQAEPVPVSQPFPRGMGGPPLREGRRETWRTNIHRLMDMEDQWDQLYHQELAMWQEERAQQREERARDRELQFRLLAVLTDIRDELRHFRQERAATQQEQVAGRQERASQTVPQAVVPEPATSPPKSEGPPPEISPEPPALPSPLKTEGPPLAPTPGRARRGEGATVTRSPRGVSRRGRGRPRGSVSKHRRSVVSHS
ncbi:hypothetical protein JRQ81_019040 [Phrynocephalus forsythii]|uniref:Uncharacterized protein n=1 Tax=Phrynocephalus forsythii TaxID=171643 RepID=A0A9Q0XPQ9_9SAUR|nr:hypothetical protein JRQ81_019040 [Phrynocephalus forsythii]